MNDPQMSDVVDQLLAGTSTPGLDVDWRELIDLASDLLPASQAAVVSAVLQDRSSVVGDLSGSLGAVPTFEVNDGPVHIGSVEPESLDFTAPGEVVPTLSTGEDLPDIDDFEFGIGDEDALEAVKESEIGSELEDVDDSDFDFGVSVEDIVEEPVVVVPQLTLDVDLSEDVDEREVDDVDL